MEDERWAKVREIVRQECERIEARILAVLAKQKPKVGFENGKWTGVTEEQMSAWKSAYGAVDVEAELKKAAAWIVSNPHLAPKSQPGRFINTWLSKQQNQLSLRSIPGGREPRQAEKMFCDYCGAPRTGVTNGWAHCSKHGMNAMDDERPMVKAG